MNRMRFVMLGAIFVAVALFGPSLIDRLRAERPGPAQTVSSPPVSTDEVWVPTAHRAVLLVDYPVDEIEALVHQIEALQGVLRVDLVSRQDVGQGPVTTRGTISYDDFALEWGTHSPVAGFAATLSAKRLQHKREPDPQAIDAAMIALEQLILSSESGNALFITDEEIRASL